MGFNFENLDDKTRKMMETELDFDLMRGRLYLSDRLNGIGKSSYPPFLRKAIRSGNDGTLAIDLRADYFNTKETRITKNGPVLANVPITANETLAEGEFNRFYIRGLCIRAIGENRLLLVYRAKQVMNPRIESERIVGKTFDPRLLLDDLRASIGVDTSLGLPKGPNSGLSVKLQ